MCFSNHFRVVWLLFVTNLLLEKTWRNVPSVLDMSYIIIVIYIAGSDIQTHYVTLLQKVNPLKNLKEMFFLYYIRVRVENRLLAVFMEISRVQRDRQIFIFWRQNKLCFNYVNCFTSYSSYIIVRQKYDNNKYLYSAFIWSNSI